MVETIPEKVLDMEPENAEAYLGKLMAALKVCKREQLKDCKKSFHNQPSYEKVLHFGDAKLKSELQGYVEHINERNEQERQEQLYFIAQQRMKCASSVEDYQTAVKEFDSLGTYKDATEQSRICQRKVRELQAKIEAERLEKAERARKRKQRKILLAVLAVVAVVAFLVVTKVIIPNQKYDAAVALMNEGNYTEAYETFKLLNGYKDSEGQTIVAYQQHKMSELNQASVGTYITLGAYEQDVKTGTGKEDVEWQVLAKENNRLLVISRYALDTKRFNEKFMDVTWETCTLRKWLNNDFQSFTIPGMTRKIGIESTISHMIPPKNILINTGSPQHAAAIITAPKELS